MLKLLSSILATLLVFTSTTSASTGQESADELPSAHEIEEAVEALELAFKKGKTPERLEALEKFGGVNDAEVIHCVAKGLSDKEPTVQLAAVDALRWLDHPAALAALHKAFKKDKKIKKNDQLYEAFVWSIGQHGDKESISVLTDGALASAPRKVQVARVYSLGHIRDRESVSELMDLLQKTGGGGRRGRGAQPLMKEISISLQVLTGQDLGKDEQAWLKWWRANKKSFKVSARPEGLPKRIQKAWQRRWTKPEPKASRGDEDGDEGEGEEAS